MMREAEEREKRQQEAIQDYLSKQQSQAQEQQKANEACLKRLENDLTTLLTHEQKIANDNQQKIVEIVKNKESSEALFGKKLVEAI